MEEIQKVKAELRQLALEAALKIRPSAVEAADRAIPNGSDSVMKDADKFYNWLIKDL